MARTIYGNNQRYKETYFSAYPGRYFTGDGSFRDLEGISTLLNPDVVTSIMDGSLVK